MKKEYIKPEVVVEEIQLESCILTVSRPDTDIPVIGGGDLDDDDVATNKRRGTWGNLWDNGEN